MQQKSAEEMAAALSLLLHQQLGVKGGGLETKISNAGRLLPGRIRRKAAIVVEAERFAASPKLSRLTDERALDKAYREVETYLNRIDPGDRRRGRIINFLGLLSLNLLAVGALLIAVLVWQGYL
jgi:hypothetical protein